MREFTYIRSSRNAGLEPLRTALLDSPLIGKSTLNGSFQQSRGFAIVFKTEGRPELEQRFPELKAHLDRVLGEPAMRALEPWWRRFRPRVLVAPNAWYLNVLLVGEGGHVGPHIDATLSKPAGVPGASPLVVSVLYLRTPQRRGGELVLADDGEIKGVVFPREGALLHFRGDLLHEVRIATGMQPGQVRASLVIEQYHFEPEALARLPAFKLDSTAGFGAYLDQHARVPPKQFELE